MCPSIAGRMGSNPPGCIAVDTRGRPVTLLSCTHMGYKGSTMETTQEQRIDDRHTVWRPWGGAGGNKGMQLSEAQRRKGG